MRTASTAILALALCACGSSDDAGSAEPDGGGGTGGTGGGAGATECPATPQAPGTTDELLDPENPRGRSYTLHIPPGDGAKPLVLNLHAFLSRGPQQVMISKMNTVADEEGFVVAYPTGMGTLTAWNAGTCCEWGMPERDDVAFLDQVIEQVAGKTCVDRDRIYATGFSNGGFLSYRLACERSETYAAVASVAGVLGIDPAECTPTRPVPLMHVHGTADLIVPHGGGQPIGFEFIFQGSAPPVFASVDSSIAVFRDLLGCSETTEVTFQAGATTCDSFSGCDPDGELVRCTVQGGGHQWPGGDAAATTTAFGTFAAFLGPYTSDLDTSREIWSFFSRHSL